MEPVVKMVGLGVGGTSVATSTAYGVYEFSRAKDLRDLLFDKGLLTEEEGTDIWTKLVTKYEENTSSNKFPEFTLTATSDSQTKTKADQLKDKCLSALSTSVSNTEQIEKLKEPTTAWCTKESNNFKSLSTATGT